MQTRFFQNRPIGFQVCVRFSIQNTLLAILRPNGLGVETCVSIGDVATCPQPERLPYCAAIRGRIVGQTISCFPRSVGASPLSRLVAA